MLRLLGLAGQSERFYRAARATPRGETVDLARLRRIVRWSGASQSIPEGLGTFGTPPADARTRLARWLDAATGIGSAFDPADLSAPGENVGHLLTGLEWQEAMFVLNSVPVESLRLLPESAPKKDDADQHHSHRLDGGKHG
jgi:hypothetical protein